VQVCTADLCSALSEAEAQDTRALFIPGDGVPQLPDFARMTSLHSLDVLARSGWLFDQLAEGRFISFFHPIVHAEDIDRVFAHEALLPRKLLEIGHGMGIGTVVEGIEVEAELSWVRENGADFVQGFLLGKPSPVVRS